MANLFRIKEVSAEETYPVRQEVLRPGRPPGECIFEGDSEETTLHLAIFKDTEIVAVASYMKNSSPQFSSKIQNQLRGMAVKESQRGKGLGAMLLKKGEKILLQRHENLVLWFNARETAINFYEKFGYTTIGEKFMIPNVCMHIVMFRRLPATT